MTGQSSSFVVPDNDPAAILWNRVEDGEKEVLRQLLTGPPVMVGQIAQSLGIQVLSASMPSNVSGQIRLRPGDQVYEIKINIADAPVRQRFTVAHEIAHYLLHRIDIDGDGITDTVLYRSSLSDRKEAEANRMAAFILLPWTAVSDWCRTNHGRDIEASLLKLISQAWKVSDLTVGYRFGF